MRDAVAGRKPLGARCQGYASLIPFAPQIFIPCEAVKDNVLDKKLSIFQ
jgi:hypothetical protein